MSEKPSRTTLQGQREDGDWASFGAEQQPRSGWEHGYSAPFGADSETSWWWKQGARRQSGREGSRRTEPGSQGRCGESAVWWRSAEGGLVLPPQVTRGRCWRERSDRGLRGDVSAGGEVDKGLRLSRCTVDAVLQT